MASLITDIPMSNAKAYFGKMATTNYFQVYLGGFGSDFSNKLAKASWGPQITDQAEFGKFLGILCSDASIPASTYATAEVKDNFMGVPQEFAHTRLYTDIDFTFYVDGDYQVLSFFEFWMNYIGAGNDPSLDEPAASSSAQPNNYRRFTYPDEYKTSQFYILKFERDFNNVGAPRLQYQLVNAFPKSVNAVPVSYGPTELMKVSVTMTYDRYIVTKLRKEKSVAALPGQPKPESAGAGERVFTDSEKAQREAFRSTVAGRTFRSAAARSIINKSIYDGLDLSSK